MQLLKKFGEMWARNAENIREIPRRSEGGVGVYVLYDGSTPVYVAKGNIKRRLTSAHKSRRKGNAWDYFSWYALADKALAHDVEVLLIRVLPSYIRHLTRQSGHFRGLRSTDQQQQNRTPVYIDRVKLMKSRK